MTRLVPEEVIEMTSESRRQDDPLEAGNVSGIEETTEIDNEVIASIAGHAARQVEGVVRLGGSGLMQSVTGRSESASYARGVRAEAGRREAIFDIELVVGYGHPIPIIAENLRRKVSNEVKEQTGLMVKAINLNIIGIQFQEQEQETREPQVE